MTDKQWDSLVEWSDRLMRKLFWGDLIKVVLLVLIFIFIICDSAHAQPAQDTLITFVDGADLQRQVREISSVCDTAVIKIYNQTYYDFKGPGIAIKDTMFILKIRCRTNMQVIVVQPSEWRNGYSISNSRIGEALITWERE